MIESDTGISRVSLQRLQEQAKCLVPPLDGLAHKGKSGGRLAIVGGCLEYTGAPFYAAMTAIRMGVDLVHVFCTKEAAVPLKSYSPELIVMGVMPDEASGRSLWEKTVAKFRQWIPRMHAVVIGPGLGRDPVTMDMAMEVAKLTAQWDIPLVLDADPLVGFLSVPSSLLEHPCVVLTPNLAEWQRMRDRAATADADYNVMHLCRRSSGCAVLLKGPTDKILLPLCQTPLLLDFHRGCPKRAGGQGDILSGTVGAFLAWATLSGWWSLGIESAPHASPLDVPDEGDVEHKAAERKRPLDLNHPAVIAAAGGSLVTREAAARAFATHRRSMTATDMIAEVAGSFEKLFPS